MLEKHNRDAVKITDCEHSLKLFYLHLLEIRFFIKYLYTPQFPREGRRFVSPYQRWHFHTNSFCLRHQRDKIQPKYLKQRLSKLPSVSVCHFIYYLDIIYISTSSPNYLQSRYIT